MTLLTLVRHGETDWNRDARIQGSTDIPLNDTGRAQARETGRRLADESDAAAPLVVVSSDLSRAAETADIIAGILQAGSVRRYPGLRERAYGEAEGLRAGEFHARWGDWHRAEVPGAEPWPVVQERALRAIQDVVRDAPDDAQVIAVAHGALIRQVIRFATDGELPREGERLPNGSTHVFRVAGEQLTLLSYVGAAV